MKTPATNQTLPRAQQAALDALAKFRSQNPYPPTYAELGKVLGVRETAVRFSIGELVIKGLVARQEKIARSLSVTAAGELHVAPEQEAA